MVNQNTRPKQDTVKWYSILFEVILFYSIVCRYDNWTVSELQCCYTSSYFSLVSGGPQEGYLPDWQQRTVLWPGRDPPWVSTFRYPPYLFCLWTSLFNTDPLEFLLSIHMSRYYLSLCVNMTFVVSSWCSVGSLLCEDKKEHPEGCVITAVYVLPVNMNYYITVSTYELLQLKSEDYIHLSQIHLNSVFHNNWHLIQV